MLTVLEQKLAEAHGLALAATVVTTKVGERTEDVRLLDPLRTMRADADETRVRCLVVEERLASFDEVRAHVVWTHERASDLAAAWFKAGTDPLRAWSFLAMSEEAEVAAWSAVAALGSRARSDDVTALAAWALPLQRRHLDVALDGSVALAETCEPFAPRWG